MIRAGAHGRISDGRALLFCIPRVIFKKFPKRPR